ncbi:hypothetical protein HDV05_004512 [Chytridiales sp. JEL 0842]|nr:hypothetical protein HDV05_004512 [Chytridiales sp. JEL 0842]
MGDIQRAFQRLAENPDNAESILIDISARILEAANVNRSDMLAAIFSKENGLLTFLNKARDSASAKAKVVAFGFLGDLATLFHSDLANMATEMQTYCWLYFNSKEGALVKKASVHALKSLVGARLFPKEECGLFYSRYMSAYIQGETKLVSSVKSAVLELLGSLVRYYPDAVPDTNQLRRKFMFTIKVSLESNKPDLDMIAGAINGLCDYLYTYELAAADFDSIFDALKSSLIISEDLNRYNVVTAGLNLLANHASKFRSGICKDKNTILEMHRNLSTICAHKNTDLAKLGLKAMETFLQEVADVLISGKHTDSNREVFWHFCQYYMSILSVFDIPYKDTALAVKALGTFFGPCKLFMTSEELSDIRTLLIQRILSVFSEFSQEAISYLPIFLDTLRYISADAVIEDELLKAIETTVGYMLVNFKRIRTRVKYYVSSSVIDLFSGLHQKNPSIANHWRRIVYQALVLTCSNFDEFRDVVEDNVDISSQPTYVEYMPFWETVYKTAEETKDINFRIVSIDGVMQSILELPSNLNLTIVDATDKTVLDATMAVIDTNLEAQMPKDFNIFIDYVTFCETFLSRLNQVDFSRWFPILVQRLLSASSQNPLVSGYYKLLAVILQLADKYKAFEDVLRDDDAMEVFSSSARDMKHQILEFLGSIGELSKLVITESFDEANFLAWDRDKHLQFKLPFQEVILDVYLGNKFFWSEDETPYHRLYEKLFPVILRLAVDSDSVARNLFRSLVLQTIHWLTKNERYENPETMAMLQASFDAASSPNGALREFGAECVSEYLIWSIKHMSEKDLSSNPQNIKSLMKRLFAFCQHTSASKRLGASLIFNRIYRTFREYDSLVDMFSFELLYHFLISLKRADGELSAQGTIAMTRISVNHLGKIIEGKKTLFASDSRLRRSFDGLEKPTLTCLKEWLLLSAAGSKEYEYSQGCLEVFCKISANDQTWLKQYTRKQPDALVRIFEHSDLEEKKKGNSNVTVLWIKHLITTISGYSLLLAKGLADFKDTFGNPSSVLFETLSKYFHSAVSVNEGDSITALAAEQLSLRGEGLQLCLRDDAVKRYFFESVEIAVDPLDNTLGVYDLYMDHIAPLASILLQYLAENGSAINIATKAAFVERIMSWLYDNRTKESEQIRSLLNAMEEKLNDVITAKFPMDFKELEGRPDVGNDYLMAIGKLFKTMQQIPNSIVIEKALIKHICQNISQKVGSQFVKAIGRKARNMDQRSFENLSQFAYGLLSDNVLPGQVRRLAFRRLLHPLLLNSPTVFVRGFFISNISAIVATINASLPEKSKDIKDELSKKACAFDMIQICYIRLSMADVHSKNGVILQALLGPGKTTEGKELTIAIIKSTNDARKKTLPPDASLANPILEYQQAAYNAMAACLISTQSSSKEMCLLIINFSETDLVSRADMADKELLLKMMRYLTKNLVNNSKADIRKNLRIYRAVVEKFKTALVSPTDVIYDLLLPPPAKTDKYKNLTGIYVSQCLIANEITLFDTCGLGDKMLEQADFYNCFVALLDEKPVETYMPAAEVLGQLLTALNKADGEAYNVLKSATEKKIDEVYSKASQSDYKCFINILNRISLSYADLAVKNFKKLLYVFFKLDIEMQGRCLEIILSCADRVENLFIELQGMNILSFLHTRDDICQTLLYGILNIVSPQLTTEQVKTFLEPAIEGFSPLSAERCRVAFYSLMCRLEKLEDQIVLDQKSMELIRMSILRGLSDSSDSIRDTLMQYMNETAMKNLSIFQRMEKTLGVWYIPAAEESFLSYATTILFDACKMGPMYEQKIHDRRLPDATFGDSKLALDVSWMHSATMLPMFAQSQTQGLPEYSDESNGGVRAIAAELAGNYDAACERYIEGLSNLGTEINDAEPDMWARARLSCLNKLGEWDMLAKSVLADLEENAQVSWDEDKRDPYLSLFIRSFLKLKDGHSFDSDELTPWTIGRPNPLFQFIAESQKDVAKRQYLESYFFKELVLIAFVKEDMNMARHLLSSAYDKFLEAFESIQVLAHDKRLNLLSGLQPLYEVGEFLEFIKVQSNARDKAKVERFLSGWRARYPSPQLDVVETWDDVITGRRWMFDKLRRLTSSKKKEQQTYARMMAKAAQKQSIFSLAERWLKDASKNKGEVDEEFMMQYFKLNLAKCETATDIPTRYSTFDNLLRNLIHYQSNMDMSNSLFRAKLANTNAKLYTVVITWLLQNGDELVNALDTSKSLRRLTGGVPLRRVGSYLEFFLRDGQEKVMTVIEELHTGSNKDQVSTIQKSMLELVKFCEHALRSLETYDEEAEVSKKIDRLTCAETFTTLVLQCMEMGSIRAIDYFPRILSMAESYNLGSVISTYIEKVPCWMVLGWLPQITAVLDKEIGRPLFGLLAKIANEYPNALRFPLNISSEQYTFDASNTQNLRAIEHLKSTLKSNDMDTFIEELRRLEDPVHVYKDWIEKLEVLMETYGNLRPDLLENAYLELKNNCLDSKRLGLLARKFSEKHGSNISRLCKGNWKSFQDKTRKELTAYRSKLGSDFDSKPGMNPLKLFSPWLSNYQVSNLEDVLEMPGQYVPKKKPVVPEHVKIAGFAQNVLVMGSIRRPKRLTMIGSDEKEYMWLVKGGEDLRLDQRVQQMFTIVNEIMQKDSACSRQNITLRTYKVIPMSTSLGIIEWVDSTKPLKACMGESPSFGQDFTESANRFSKFVNDFGSKNYEPYLTHVKRDHLIKTMNDLWNTTSPAYLTNFFQRLVVSPEAFLTVRSGFANSLSALNIASYILGIGDRHLENFLIDLKSGRIVGIDFGHAFGSATEVLPIPEMVPFRLTKQIEKFLDPLGVSVLMKYPMTHVLTVAAIQNNKNVVMNALDIFVKEPLMEWRKFASMNLKKQGFGSSPSAVSGNSKLESSSSSSASSEPSGPSLSAPAWYPQRKLEIARRKLEKDNPAYIMADELTMAHEQKKWFKNSKAAILGDAAYNARAKVDKKCLDAKEQVECLIDLACDANVLLRQWVGWSPWLAEEFFRESMGRDAAIAGPSGTQRGFEFRQMGKELEEIMVNPGMHENWAADFAGFSGGDAGPMMGREGMHEPIFEEAFNQARQQQGGQLQLNRPAMWTEEFQEFQAKHDSGPLFQPHLEAEFERAFDQAKQNLEWAQEFQAQQPQSWADEFDKEIQKDVNITGDAKETLSKTAGLLLDVIESSDNPKFKQSKFMDFMKQLRDQKVSIEGNKVVDNVEPVAGPASLAADWAKEFGTTLNASSWEEEFNFEQQSGQSMAGPSSSSWANELQSNHVNQAEAHRAWADEFQSTHQVDQAAAEKAWADEFAQSDIQTNQLDTGNEELEKAYQEFYGSSAPFTLPSDSQSEEARAAEWESMQKQWEEHEKENALLLEHQYDSYPFTTDNPYLNRPIEFLTNPLSHRTLTESILALEAAVQKEPQNAQAWKNLGLRQQENENEAAAIAALRASVKADAGVLESWLALAASYTNEGNLEDAYTSLESWLTNNETYRHLMAGVSRAEGVKRHDFLLRKLMEAARLSAGSGEGLDANVQIALGILLNISQDFDKAVDCFEAGLSKYPQDYMLWNKLGATLSNSMNPARALDAYRSALEINPSFIRARYNFGVACIQLGQYKEAVEHFLSALAIQQESVNMVSSEFGSNLSDSMGGMHSISSNGIWTTLRSVLAGYMMRNDLVDLVDRRNLDAFKSEFTF